MTSTDTPTPDAATAIRAERAIRSMLVDLGASRCDGLLMARACEFALKFAARLHVVAAPDAPNQSHVWMRRADGVAAARFRRGEVITRLGEAAATFRRSRIDGSTRLLDARTPEAVAAIAIEAGADLVLTEAHLGWDQDHVYRGAFDIRLARLSPVPVLFVRRGRSTTPARVLAALDVDDERVALDRAIVRNASTLARSLGAELHVVHATRPLPAARRVTDHAAHADAAVDARARLGRTLAAEGIEIGTERVHVEFGDVAELVLARARALDADVVAIGTSRRTPPEGVLAGDLDGHPAEQVLDGAPGSVLCVRANAADLS